MKKFIIMFTLIAVVALPFRDVHANLESVAVRNFVVLSTFAACAVSIEILAIQQNLLNGNEALLLNGLLFAFFTAAIVATGLSVGQIVLFGSPAFAAEAGITPDVMIDDAQCESVQEGDEFTFLGSSGGVVSLLPLVMTLLVLQLAILLNAGNSAYGEFDLAVFFLTMVSLVTSVIVGNINGQNAQGGGGSTGGGCSLQKAESNSKTPWALLLMGFFGMGAAGWQLRRRYN